MSSTAPTVSGGASYAVSTNTIAFPANTSPGGVAVFPVAMYDNFCIRMQLLSDSTLTLVLLIGDVVTNMVITLSPSTLTFAYNTHNGVVWNYNTPLTPVSSLVTYEVGMCGGDFYVNYNNVPILAQYIQIDWSQSWYNSYVSLSATTTSSTVTTIANTEIINVNFVGAPTYIANTLKTTGTMFTPTLSGATLSNCVVPYAQISGAP